MKLQDVLVHGETVTVQLSVVAATQQAMAHASARVQRVNGQHRIVFHVGPFSLFGGIEVEVGDWYTRCVTTDGPELERVLIAPMGAAILAIWQRKRGGWTEAEERGDGDE
jgi:hypothetical protein